MTGAMRGPAFFAYADNYLIDVKVAYHGRRPHAIRQSESCRETMIERTRSGSDIKPERCCRHGYGSASTAPLLVNDNRSRPISLSSTSRSAMTHISRGTYVRQGRDI